MTDYIEPWLGWNCYKWIIFTIAAAFLVAQIVNVILAWVILNALNQIL